MEENANLSHGLVSPEYTQL